MSFLKLKVRQQADGKPGFIDDDEFEIQVNVEKITLFNKSEDDKDITFVRLACGATLCVAVPYNTFVKKLQAAMKPGAKAVK
jgi:hypothetical protein